MYQVHVCASVWVCVHISEPECSGYHLDALTPNCNRDDWWEGECIRSRNKGERFLLRLGTYIMLVAFCNKPVRSYMSSSLISAWKEKCLIAAMTGRALLPHVRDWHCLLTFSLWIPPCLFLLELTACQLIPFLPPPLFNMLTNTSLVTAAETILNLTGIKTHSISEQLPEHFRALQSSWT